MLRVRFDVTDKHGLLWVEVQANKSNPEYEGYFEHLQMPIHLEQVFPAVEDMLGLTALTLTECQQCGRATSA